MHLPELLHTLSTHRDDLEALGVASLAIFGSVARSDEDTTSDVDILVRFSKPVGMFEFLDVKAYLEDLLGSSVDLVTEDALKPQLRERILAEAVRAA